MAAAGDQADAAADAGNRRRVIRHDPEIPNPKRGFVMLCRHCNRVPSNRPRGLCWSCYYKPGVRDLYPSTSKFGAAASRIASAECRRPRRRPVPCPAAKKKC